MIEEMVNPKDDHDSTPSEDIAELDVSAEIAKTLL
jgi:hypothetical protein